MVCSGAGPGSVTPAMSVGATDVNQSTASTVSSQVLFSSSTHLHLHIASMSIGMRPFEGTYAQELKCS